MLEFAKTKTWTFPDHIFASSGTYILVSRCLDGSMCVVAKTAFWCSFFFFFLAKASVCAQDFRRVEQGVEERYQDPSHYKGAEDIHSALQTGCGVAGPALAHYLKEKSTKRHCAEI